MDYLLDPEVGATPTLQSSTFDIADLTLYSAVDYEAESNGQGASREIV
jgi:hypothetical protein